MVSCYHSPFKKWKHWKWTLRLAWWSLLKGETPPWGFFSFSFVLPLCFGLLWDKFWNACPQGLLHQGGWGGPAPVWVAPFHKQDLDKMWTALSLRYSSQLLPFSSAVTSSPLIWTIPVRAPPAREINAGGKKVDSIFPLVFRAML